MSISCCCRSPSSEAGCPATPHPTPCLDFKSCPLFLYMHFLPQAKLTCRATYPPLCLPWVCSPYWECCSLPLPYIPVLPFLFNATEIPFPLIEALPPSPLPYIHPCLLVSQNTPSFTLSYWPLSSLQNGQLFAGRVLVTSLMVLSI